MDNLITINASLTYPLEQLEKFADNRGYQTVIANPAYQMTANEDGTITSNGLEATLPNPQNRIEFVKEWFKKEAVTLFAVDFKRDAQVQAQELAKQIEDGAKAALAQAITIE